MTLAPDDTRRLAHEAAFADGAYSKFADQLALNELFFRKYSAPTADWDWRQWGAKRLGSVAGCKVLDYGCGAGEESLYLAKMGGDVTAIDISPVGVRLANERARFNGLDSHVKAHVMRCDPTDFPGDSFDVVHGFGILHHVGLEPGLSEVHRLLRPGGRGLFFEHMGNSRLVEWLRPKEGHCTEDEKPVKWSDVAGMSTRFSVFEMKPFHVVSRLRGAIGFCGSHAVKRVDHAMLSICPPLRFLASGLVIYLEK